MDDGRISSSKITSYIKVISSYKNRWRKENQAPQYQAKSRYIKLCQRYLEQNKIRAAIFTINKNYVSNQEVILTIFKFGASRNL